MAPSIEVSEALKSVIQRWRFALRRGDGVAFASLDQEITEAIGDDEELALLVGEEKWAKESEPLLTPGPLAALREALDLGWNLRVAQIAVKPSTEGIDTEYLAVLGSPSGHEFDGQSPQRDIAFRQALEKAGISF